MDDPKSLARAITRALAQQAAPSPSPPAPLPASDAERPDVFAAIYDLFVQQDERIDALERRIAELEARPAARSIEHIRDASGAVIRSVVLETPAP
jgi:hypothetical protein